VRRRLTEACELSLSPIVESTCIISLGEPHMRMLLSAIIIFSTTAVSAESNVQCNEHGAVVTMATETIYYLGKNCDAARQGGGTGRWWLTASAFAIEIDGQIKLLPFDVDCDLPACWFDS